MMQAFAYRHLVPSRDLKVSVTRRGVFRTPVEILGAQPVKLLPGEIVRLEVRMTMTASNVLGNVRFELSDPPAGVSLREASLNQEGSELVLECDAAKAKPGLKGNLIVNILAERTPPAANGRPQANRQRVSLGTLPAIPYEIVKR